jgi:3-oxoadipate enol-lactonase
MTALRLHAERSGRPEGPVVVMGCSLGSTTRVWQVVADRLAADYRVVVLDTRGHGGSPVPPGPYTIAELGGDALRTIDELGIGEFCYVGVSLGGQVGMWVAAEAPDRVQRLSLWCTAATLGTPQGWHERAATVRASGTGAVADAVVARWFTPSYAAANDAVVASWREEIASTPAEGYAACCDALATLDLRDRLGSITAPTLVVGGAADPVASADLVAQLAAGIRSSRLVTLPDAAHLAPLEQPAATTGLLLEFLDGGDR